MISAKPGCFWYNVVMTDKRKSRGPAPDDRKCFGPEQVETLRTAVRDHSWLLTRGYAQPGALKLVGDRYSLRQRQRTAVMRAACSDQSLSRRCSTCLGFSDLKGRGIIIDGYNLLITIESALSGALILKCRDGTCRDLAALHSTYRRIEQTLPALEEIADILIQGRVGHARLLFDRPVSNSGRLKMLARDLFHQRNLDWQVETSQSPDREMIESDRVVISSDSAVLDRCETWTNAAAMIVNKIDDPWLLDLSR